MRKILPFYLLLSTLALTGCTSVTSKKMMAGRDAMKQAWTDATSGNWEVCAMNLSTTLGHVREGIEAKPVRKTKSGDVALAPYLQALEAGPLARLQSAARRRDKAAFQVAYVETANSCIACHTAAERPKICLRLPEAANTPQ